MFPTENNWISIQSWHNLPDGELYDSSFITVVNQSNQVTQNLVYTMRQPPLLARRQQHLYTWAVAVHELLPSSSISSKAPQPSRIASSKLVFFSTSFTFHI